MVEGGELANDKDPDNLRKPAVYGACDKACLELGKDTFLRSTVDFFAKDWQKHDNIQELLPYK